MTDCYKNTKNTHCLVNFSVIQVHNYFFFNDHGGYYLITIISLPQSTMMTIMKVLCAKQH